MLVVNKDRLFFGKYGVVHLVHKSAKLSSCMLQKC